MGRIVQLFQRDCRHYCDEINDGWNRFWFIPRDPFAMSVMRILVGWMAFYTTLVWGLRMEAFFGETGFNSMEMIESHLLTYEGPFALSFWYWVPQSWTWPVHYLSLAVTFCFMIGLCTRVTSVLSLIVLISYAYRARYANYGLDQINAILTFYLCLAHSGAYLSIDRLIKKWKASKLGLSLQEYAPVAPDVATNIATRLTQLHYCVIYLAAGLGKLQGETWWDGSAMWRGLANAEYQTLDMTWLAHYPWMTEYLTHLTIAWEVSFAFLIWRPVMRPWMILLGLGMHFGIGLMLGMWTFGTCMMFGYLAFFEPNRTRQIIEMLFKVRFATTSGHPEPLPEDRIASASVLAASLEKNDPQATHSNHVILFDRNQESARLTLTELVQLGYRVSVTQEFNDLLALLEQDHEAIVIANLQKLDGNEIDTYLNSILPVNLNQVPCVTMLRNRHLDQLAGETPPDYQRIVILPCDRLDLLRELDQALEQFELSFPNEWNRRPETARETTLLS